MIPGLSCLGDRGSHLQHLGTSFLTWFSPCEWQYLQSRLDTATSFPIPGYSGRTLGLTLWRLLYLSEKFKTQRFPRILLSSGKHHPKLDLYFIKMKLVVLWGTLARVRLSLG